eukprot:TRINITY_DN19576_c0_g1_i1.p1 TRINITY_DN19576_c0_g1~~TRINITY_DN19576_c0_g1_i1.p1  ORF type:complete len:273 (+),score=57.89 TRINITY_DN19576_c0_g1_i1:68-886(+)
MGLDEGDAEQIQLIPPPPLAAPAAGVPEGAAHEGLPFIGSVATAVRRCWRRFTTCAPPAPAPGAEKGPNGERRKRKYDDLKASPVEDAGSGRACFSTPAAPSKRRRMGPAPPPTLGASSSPSAPAAAGAFSNVVGVGGTPLSMHGERASATLPPHAAHEHEHPSCAEFKKAAASIAAIRLELESLCYTERVTGDTTGAAAKIAAGRKTYNERMMQVLLSLDGVSTDGLEELRRLRKGLINDVQTFQDNLKEFIKREKSLDTLRAAKHVASPQ